MKSMKILFAAAAMTLAFSASAEAYPYHHGGSHVFIGGYFGPTYYPTYPAYYAYPGYYYADPYAYPPPTYAPPPQAAPQAQPQHADNSYCREYHSNSLIAGHTHTTYGTACMQPDGSWRIEN